MDAFSTAVRGRAVRTLIVLGIGQVSGPLMDQIHVQTGTLWYEHPALFEQAVWVGPQFALAFVGLDFLACGIISAVDQRMAAGGATDRPTSRAPMWWLVVAFVIAYAITGLLHEHQLVVAAILAAGFAVRAAFERFSVSALAMAGALAVVGTTYEVALMSVPETFSYPDDSLLVGAPLWLPLLYMHGAPVLVRAAKRLPFAR